MAEQPNTKKQSSQGTSREDRLKAALKANLARRKAQAKVRKSAAPKTQASPDDAQE